jgi:2'-5' RNA ligase
VADGAPWRTFVAFPIAEATRAALARETARLGRAEPRLRLVPADNFHLTLAFLGATPPEDVPRVAEALAEVARSTPALRVRVEGLGAFPGPGTPRVVWAGMTEVDPTPRGALEDVARRCREALEAAGRRVDRGERFHAHVTLGRLEVRPPSRELGKRLTAATLQSTNEPEVLSDLLLMISEPGPDRRTRYRPLATASLEPIAGGPA